MNNYTLWILCINIPCCITFACIKHDNVTFCLYLASYIGCFKDDENRMFDDRRTDSNAMTVDMCISDCRTRHSVYSGVQVSLEHLLDILHLQCTDSCKQLINWLTSLTKVWRCISKRLEFLVSYNIICLQWLQYSRT